MQSLSGRMFLCLIVLIGAFAGGGELAQPDPFEMQTAKILQDDEDLGLANGHVTCGVSKHTPGALGGIWAPPYVSSDFHAAWRIDGQPLASETGLTWRPQSTLDHFAQAGLRADAATWLVPGDRCIVQALRLTAGDGAAKEVEVGLECGGTLERVARWEFARPQSKAVAARAAAGEVMTLTQGDAALVVQAAALGNATDAGYAQHVQVKPDAPAVIFVTYALGANAESARAIGAKALAAAQADAAAFAPRATPLPYALPEFHSDNPALDRWFARSLVHLVMNRWDVPEFALHPYYGTGSVKGGCVCNYLWNFGEVWEILPLLDPAATKAHIKHFLACDLRQHFAFDPISGEAFGPWYMVNQEKIIGLIYFYEVITGDRAFLAEKVGEKTIAEHAVEQALAKDDLSKPATLIDYGPSNSHLELRKQWQYNHVMSDLNGRRYENLTRAAAIAAWAGTPRPELLAHAEEVRAALETLWDPQAKWYAFVNEKGERELRYTMQVFKLFNSPVLSVERVDGLLSHFNEREFFSAQGMHSMSKLDPAYDQVDIDNGGGGACTSFPPQIAERLYKLGKTAEADDILRRILWWGERMPYWGDSIVANDIAYRKDTPLQCTIDGAAAAQCIIFGLLGIAAGDDGTVAVTPRKTTLFNHATLRLVFRGKRLEIDIKGDGYKVIGQKQGIGEATVLSLAELQ